MSDKAERSSKDTLSKDKASRPSKDKADKAKDKASKDGPSKDKVSRPLGDKPSEDGIPKMSDKTTIIGHTISDSSGETSAQGYQATIKEWKTRGKTLAFIYDFILHKYRRRVEVFTLLGFLLMSMTSLLALGNFGISEQTHPELTMAFKATNAVLTTVSAICIGIVRVKGWSNLVESCQKYLDIVEHFVATIISEQTLPVRLRLDPEEFITQQKDKFQTILNSAPDISHDDYLQAMEYYETSKTRLRRDLINV